MKKLLISISMILLFSVNLLSQIDFSKYPEFPLNELENSVYSIIHNYVEYEVLLVVIDGITYVVLYWYESKQWTSLPFREKQIHLTTPPVIVYFAGGYDI